MQFGPNAASTPLPRLPLTAPSTWSRTPQAPARPRACSHTAPPLPSAFRSFFIRKHVTLLRKQLRCVPKATWRQCLCPGNLSGPTLALPPRPTLSFASPGLTVRAGARGHLPVPTARAAPGPVPRPPNFPAGLPGAASRRDGRTLR